MRVAHAGTRHGRRYPSDDQRRRRVSLRYLTYGWRMEPGGVGRGGERLEMTDTLTGYRFPVESPGKSVDLALDLGDTPLSAPNALFLLFEEASEGEQPAFAPR